MGFNRPRKKTKADTGRNLNLSCKILVTDSGHLLVSILSAIMVVGVFPGGGLLGVAGVSGVSYLPNRLLPV